MCDMGRKLVVWARSPLENKGFAPRDLEICFDDASISSIPSLTSSAAMFGISDALSMNIPDTGIRRDSRSTWETMTGMTTIGQMNLPSEMT